MIIDGVYFDSYKVKKVEMDLDTCKITFKCEFYGQNKVRIKEFTMNSNCDVNINQYINELDKIINETIL
jgi:hypothetical protein